MLINKSGTVNSVNGESLALQIIANLKADPFVSKVMLSCKNVSIPFVIIRYQVGVFKNFGIIITTIR